MPIAMENTNEILAALAVLAAALGALIAGRPKASSSPAAKPTVPTSETNAPPPTAPTVSVPKTKREGLYDFAKKCFDEKRHCTMNESIPKEVGCAQAVSYVLNGAGVHGIPKYGISGTYTLWDWLKASKEFERVDEPQFGDVIVSVTGTGNGTLTNGHTGIVGKWQIMSNNSKTGIWDNHWTLKEWLKYYQQDGGLRTVYYRRRG